MPTNSINFITCHDGFTLNDLVSYTHKHNEANGEDNRDGSDENWSRAEGSLRKVLTEMGLSFTAKEGEAAFYGPKADFMVRDCIGNLRQRDDAADTACVTDPTCANVRGVNVRSPLRRYPKSCALLLTAQQQSLLSEQTVLTRKP